MNGKLKNATLAQMTLSHDVSACKTSGDVIGNYNDVTKKSLNIWMREMDAFDTLHI